MPYTIPNGRNMKDAKESHIFLGIVGKPCTGKTTAALTFPNPVVMDLDGGMIAHRGKDIQTVPFFDDAYCLEVLKATRDNQGIVNKRDTVYKWLYEVAPKLDRDQTLILDTWTTLQAFFDLKTTPEINSHLTKKGEINDFWFWEYKIDYSERVMGLLKGLACNVVVVFHESQQRDANTGLLLDRAEPLMQGGFLKKLANYFDDFFRQLVITPLDMNGKQNMLEGAPVKETAYVWQIKATGQFTPKTRMSRPETFIPANYNSLTYNK